MTHHWGHQECSWNWVQGEGRLDLCGVYGQKDYVVAYACADFEVSSAPKPVILGITSDNGVKAWLNGELIHEQWAFRPARIEESVVVAHPHLLLGLLGVPDSVGARSLSRLGIPLDRIRSEVDRQVTRSRARQRQEMEFSGLARSALDYADQQAKQAGAAELGTYHLVMGLLDVGYGLGGNVLADLGVSAERLRGTLDDTAAQE
jgi:hypothetical protein